MSQQLALAAYRTPFAKIQALVLGVALFPMVAPPDSPGPAFPVQLLASAAYRAPIPLPQALRPGVAAIPPVVVPDNPGPAYPAQLTALAAYRGPVIIPQALRPGVTQFPIVVIPDNPGPAYSTQLLALAAIRPYPILVPELSNTAVLDYYETEVSLGADSLQYQTWTVYRAPFTPSQALRPGVALFPVVVTPDNPGPTQYGQLLASAALRPSIRVQQPTVNTAILDAQAANTLLRPNPVQGQAAYRAAPPQTLRPGIALIPVPLTPDNPGPDYSPQLKALAAYRVAYARIQAQAPGVANFPAVVAPVRIPPGPAVQLFAQAAWRAPLNRIPRPVSIATFVPAATGGFFARYYYHTNGIKNV